MPGSGLATYPGLYYVCVMTLNWPLAGGLLLSLATCAWLYAENRSLTEELAAARAPAPAQSAPARAAAAPALPDSAPVAAPRIPADTRRANAEPEPDREPLAARSERPSMPEPPPEETREERRKRRMARVTAIFGRLDGETEEEYLERMVPLVETTLAIPRSRLEDARRAAEEAAGVTDDQRSELDAVFDDAFAETLRSTRNWNAWWSAGGHVVVPGTMVSLIVANRANNR